jgi:type II secretory pathway pseudopilin PulG
MMMNRSDGPYHNIWTERSGAAGARSGINPSVRHQNQAGYTLVALLALMTILALLAVAAAPSLQQQARREREKEAIFRGEEVADAIRLYYSYKQARGMNGDAALPSSIDELLEGLPVGTKKVQILRSSAARDPLSESGEWHLVIPRSNELADFQRALMLFAQNVRPPTHDPQLKQVELLMAPPVLPTSDIASSSGLSSNVDDIQGPFIGVSSQSKSNSVLYYYGINHHDGWIFTPLFR